MNSTKWFLCVALSIILGSQVQSQTKTSAPTKSKPSSSTKKEVAISHPNEAGIIETSMGTIEVELYRADAPKTVENFVRLANQRFFDGVRFHRVVPGFVIQTGDDKSKDLKLMAQWGTGGKSIYGKEFEDELNQGSASYKEGYKKGVLAMANHGPNTNSSQFFIMLDDNTTLPRSYTIFGKVTKGIDVVERIGSVELDQPGARDGRPKVDVLVKKVTVKKDSPGKGTKK